MTVEQWEKHQARIQGLRPGSIAVLEWTGTADGVPLPALMATTSSMAHMNKHRRAGAYDSAAEATRHANLLALQAARLVEDVVHHPPAVPIIINGRKVAAWEPDFSYREKGLSVLEDVKGYTERKVRNKSGKLVKQSNPAWRLALLKMKMVAALHPDIEVRVEGPGGTRIIRPPAPALSPTP